MSEFDQAFASADAAAFDVMGEDIVIAGRTIRSVRDEDDYSQQMGDGGFVAIKSAGFYISREDANATSVAPGSRVLASGATKAWTVGSIKDLGGYWMLTCMAASGQQSAEF
jgi:hypothetical protein